MDDALKFAIAGISAGAVYAIAASGLVVTYTTSGIFNFAHGAIGMLAAFTYWQLRVGWGWPAPVAVVLLVLAPAFGATVERVIIRGLQDVSEVTKLIVSISLLFGVYQVAVILFSPSVGRFLPGFFGDRTIDLGVYDMSWHEAITIVAAITSKFDEPPYPTEVILEPEESGLPLRSAVVLNQIRSIDRQRLVKRLGRASTRSMDRVDQAIQISLGLIKV